MFGWKRKLENYIKFSWNSTVICKHQLWEDKRSQNGQRKKKVRESSIGAGDVEKGRHVTKHGWHMTTKVWITLWSLAEPLLPAVARWLMLSGMGLTLHGPQLSSAFAPNFPKMHFETACWFFSPWSRLVVRLAPLLSPTWRCGWDACLH